MYIDKEEAARCEVGREGRYIKVYRKHIEG
jgi:hypothetical protein